MRSAPDRKAAKEALRAAGFSNRQIKALLAFVFDRKPPEVRAMLAAPTIHKAVVAKCKKHSVESRVPRR